MWTVGHDGYFYPLCRKVFEHDLRIMLHILCTFVQQIKTFGIIKYAGNGSFQTPLDMHLAKSNMV